MTGFSSVYGLVGVNSKCGIQSKGKCESYESCVCIAGFSAFHTFRESVLSKESLLGLAPCQFSPKRYQRRLTTPESGGESEPMSKVCLL